MQLNTFVASFAVRLGVAVTMWLSVFSLTGAAHAQSGALISHSYPAWSMHIPGPQQVALELTCVVDPEAPEVTSISAVTIDGSDGARKAYSYAASIWDNGQIESSVRIIDKGARHALVTTETPPGDIAEKTFLATFVDSPAVLRATCAGHGAALSGGLVANGTAIPSMPQPMTSFHAIDSFSFEGGGAFEPGIFLSVGAAGSYGLETSGYLIGLFTAQWGKLAVTRPNGSTVEDGPGQWPTITIGEDAPGHWTFQEAIAVANDPAFVLWAADLHF